MIESCSLFESEGNDQKGQVCIGVSYHIINSAFSAYSAAKNLAAEDAEIHRKRDSVRLGDMIESCSLFESEGNDQKGQVCIGVSYHIINSAFSAYSGFAGYAGIFYSVERY